MFKKILASIGIGAAKVDTVLETEHLHPGQTFNAQVVISGSKVAQEVKGLELALMTKVKVQREGENYFANHVIEKWKVADTFQIQPDEIKSIPFEARLHAETPITQINAGYNHCYVWIETGLDIDLSLDPKDEDSLLIYPNEAIKACMQAMEKLGFSLIRADVEKGYLKANTYQSISGCYQELEYRQSSNALFDLKEVELSFITETHKTHVLIELDRTLKANGYVDLTIEHDEVNLSQLCDQLERLFS